MKRQLNDTATKTLAILDHNRGKYFSGQELAAQLNISRTAIWKAIELLRNEGYNIKASTNKGYYLDENADVFNSESVKDALTTEAKEFYKELDFFTKINSTSTYIKEERRLSPEGLVVTAETQSSGRGRFERPFYCRKGDGIYFSVLLRPACSLQESTRITAAAAVATARACEKIAANLTKGDIKIKWVNDVFFNEKKICGIMTEASVTVETGKIDFAVLGIGINLVFDKTRAPSGLNEAGGLFEGTVPPPRIRARLLAEVLNEFYIIYSQLFRGDDKNKQEAAEKLLKEYRERQFLIGKKIDVTENLFEPAKTRPATAVAVDDEFRLLVKFDDAPDKIVALNGGETRARRSR